MWFITYLDKLPTSMINEPFLLFSWSVPLQFKMASRRWPAFFLAATCAAGLLPALIPGVTSEGRRPAAQGAAKNRPLGQEWAHLGHNKYPAQAAEQGRRIQYKTLVNGQWSLKLFTWISIVIAENLTLILIIQDNMHIGIENPRLFFFQ